MGGGSGIPIIDDLNPLHQDENKGPTIGNLAGGAVKSVSNPDNIKGAATVGAIVAGGSYLMGSAESGAAVGASTTGSGYLSATGTEATTSGLGYLGTETTLSGTGAAAAELGGTGAATPQAISYASGYLGADIGGSSFVSETGSSYLGLSWELTNSAPWYESLIPSGATALGLANLYLNTNRQPASQPAQSTKGYLGTSPSFQPSGGSTISIGGQGAAQNPSQNQSILGSPLFLSIGAIGLAYLLAKKRGA